MFVRAKERSEERVELGSHSDRATLSFASGFNSCLSGVRSVQPQDSVFEILFRTSCLKSKPRSTQVTLHWRGP